MKIVENQFKYVVRKSFPSTKGKTIPADFENSIHELNKKIWNLDQELEFDIEISFYEGIMLESKIVSLCVKDKLAFILVSKKDKLSKKQAYRSRVDNLFLAGNKTLQDKINPLLVLIPAINLDEFDEFETIIKSDLIKPFLSKSFREIEKDINDGFYPNKNSYQPLMDNNYDEQIRQINSFLQYKLRQRSIGIADLNCYLLFNHEQASLIQQESLYILDEFLQEFSFNDYGFVDIVRTSRSDVFVGSYIYQIDNDKRLRLILNPLKTIVDNNGNVFVIFDKEAYEKSITSLAVFNEDEIRDFQVFGSEMMINRVETIDNNQVQGTINSPRLLGTAFREFLFGSSYSTLKGMSSMMQQLNQSIIANKVNIKTTSEIKDTRSVQLIFNDNSDIELNGILIYYDFNRKMGNVKNKAYN